MDHITVPYNNAEYLIDVTYFYAGKDAVTHLLPENCTPAEDSEIEFEIVSWEITNEGYDPDLDVEEEEEFYELAIAEMIEYKIGGATDEY